MPKPKLTNAECLKLATDAHRLPEGAIGRQYQIVLTALTMEWFLGLSSRERGTIVEAVMIATAGTTIEVNQTMENDHARACDM